MRIPLLLLITGCLTSCATHPTTPSSPPMNAAVEADGVPDPDSHLSPEQIAQLKSRLELLRVGMSRAKVMEILNISSFNVRYFAHASPTGLTYRLKHGHVLTLAMAAGDYDVTLRWAKFDGELWPKNGVESQDVKPHPGQAN